MKNDTCIVCGEKFEPRQNKLYCSDSCKQTAYNEKKQSETPEQTKPVATKPEPHYKISFSEFQEFNKERRDPLTIELFCFIRKNLSGTWNLKDFSVYLESLEQNGFWDRVWENGNNVNKEYQEFETLFHRGLIEIAN